MYGSSATPITGSANVAIGDHALAGLAGAGAYNVAIGYAAGYQGTAITTGTQNIFIGYEAQATTATDSNEIVIGEGVTGGGSNTTVIGNSSQTTLTVGGTGSLIVPAGTTGQRPSATTAGQIRYNSTSGAFEGYNGTSWITLYNPAQSAVPTEANTGLSTWENQGNATETDGPTGMQLAATGAWGSVDQPMAALCKTAPATPYSIIAEVTINGNSDNWGVMGWRNSSNGKTEDLAIWGQPSGGGGTGSTYVGWTVGGWEGYALSGQQGYGDGLWNQLPATNPVWLKLKNDGTNMYEYWSSDGQSWVEAYQEALSGSYLGATGYNQICMGLVSTSGATQILTLLNYQQTSP